MANGIRSGHWVALLACCVAGCGGKSDDGPAADTDVGGTKAAGGTASGTSGQTWSDGGVPAGGAAFGGRSGTVTSDGGKPAGGFTNGGTAIGGSALGGNASGGTSGTVTSDGGKPAGGFANGGQVSCGAPSTGGKASGGSTALGGSSGKASGGAISDGGAALADFCTGPESRVTYQGRTFTVAATNHAGTSILNCCDSLGIALHAHRELGLDFDIEIIRQVGTGTAAGTYTIGPTPTVRATFNRSSDSISTSFGLVGTFRATEQSFTTAWETGLCLGYNGTTADVAGTRFYVPKQAMMPFAWRARFEIRLLSDPNITPAQANAAPLGSLALAATPWLNLQGIKAIEATTNQVELTPGYISGSALRATLVDVGLVGRPFVVTSEGVPIYLGTFFRTISSMAPVGPVIMVDDIAEDRFTIAAPMSGTDPRFDARLVTAFTEAGKWIP